MKILAVLTLTAFTLGLSSCANCCKKPQKKEACSQCESCSTPAKKK